MQFEGWRKVAIPCKLYLTELCRRFKMRTTKIIMIGTFLITVCHFVKGSSYKEFDLLDVTKVF